MAEPEQELEEPQNLWEILKFNKGDMPSPLIEQSSFATLFPKYREKYLTGVWALVEKELNKYGIQATLDLREGTMTVKTTRKTWDPYAVINARDLIKLLSRSVPVQQALKIFDDKTFCDIIKIGRITRNKERFAKRRERLIGPNGQTLKAIELLSGCYVLIQGNTVSAMGTPKGLSLVRKIVEECMRNIHPIYNIKAEMIKREIAKNPDLKEEDWQRFVPTFKKKNAQKKAKKVKKKAKSVFPPPQLPRKVDLAMESGEYFLSPQEKQQAKRREMTEKQAQKAKERKQEREKAFVAPKEQKKSKSAEPDLQESISKIKSSGSKKRKASSQSLNDYVEGSNKKRRTSKGK